MQFNTPIYQSSRGLPLDTLESQGRLTVDADFPYLAFNRHTSDVASFLDTDLKEALNKGHVKESQTNFYREGIRALGNFARGKVDFYFDGEDIPADEEGIQKLKLDVPTLKLWRSGYRDLADQTKSRNEREDYNLGIRFLDTSLAILQEETDPVGIRARMKNLTGNFVSLEDAQHLSDSYKARAFKGSLERFLDEDIKILDSRSNGPDAIPADMLATYREHTKRTAEAVQRIVDGAGVSYYDVTEVETYLDILKGSLNNRPYKNTQEASEYLNDAMFSQAYLIDVRHKLEEIATKEKQRLADADANLDSLSEKETRNKDVKAPIESIVDDLDTLGPQKKRSDKRRTPKELSRRPRDTTDHYKGTVSGVLDTDEF